MCTWRPARRRGSAPLTPPRGEAAALCKAPPALRQHASAASRAASTRATFLRGSCDLCTLIHCMNDCVCSCSCGVPRYMHSSSSSSSSAPAVSKYSYDRDVLYHYSIALPHGGTSCARHDVGAPTPPPAAPLCCTVLCCAGLCCVVLCRAGGPCRALSPRRCWAQDPDDRPSFATLTAHLAKARLQADPAGSLSARRPTSMPPTTTAYDAPAAAGSGRSLGV